LALAENRQMVTRGREETGLASDCIRFHSRSLLLKFDLFDDRSTPGAAATRSPGSAGRARWRRTELMIVHPLAAVNA
jgi:hypothetical protein